MTAYESYRTMSWTSDSDECEADCGVIMGEGRYVEGDLGHYCSEDCRDECESDSFPDERAAERRQMGIDY